MDFKDLYDRIETAINLLKRDRKKNTFKIMSDVKTLMSNRVIETGVNADGKKFSDYSDKDVPYTYFYDNVPAGMSEDRVDDAVDTLGVLFSYKDWREEIGRPTAYKNFSLSGQFWKNIHVNVISDGKNATIIRIAPKSQRNKEILRHQSERENISILAISDDEYKIAVELNRQRLLNTLKEADLL